VTIRLDADVVKFFKGRRNQTRINRVLRACSVRLAETDRGRLRWIVLHAQVLEAGVWSKMGRCRSA
jgi:hypothetical protein